MERFTIGRCRSGKIITSHSALDSFSTFEEVFDAMAVLSLLASRAHRRQKGSEEAQHLEEETEKLRLILLESKQWQMQMDAIGAKTSVDIRRYANNLLRPEFKD